MLTQVVLATVYFSVCSLTMLSKVVLQFLFSLLLTMHSQVTDKSYFFHFAVIIHDQLYRYTCYSKGHVLMGLYKLPVFSYLIINSPRRVYPQTSGHPIFN